MPPVARLVLGDQADVVRRQLGPRPWAALEVLVSCGHGSTTGPRADVSVRDVARSLGVAKNTAHRALRRLIDEGLVVPSQPRESDGRFAVGGYVLAVPADVLHTASVATGIETTRRATTTSPRPTRRRNPVAGDSQQLTLLPG